MHIKVDILIVWWILIMETSSVFLLDKNTTEALYIGLSIWNDSQNWAIWSRSCPGDSGGRWDDLNPPPKGSEFFEAHKTPLKTDGYIAIYTNPECLKSYSFWKSQKERTVSVPTHANTSFFKGYSGIMVTLQETNISPTRPLFKMNFLFPRCNMLVP